MAIISSMLAKISAILMILTIAVWPLKAGEEKEWMKKDGKLTKVYKGLEKSHQILGKILILSALAHGIMSSGKLFSLNSGTACWVMAVVLGIMTAFKKESNEKTWKIFHRSISVIAFALMVVHIVTVI